MRLGAEGEENAGEGREGEEEEEGVNDLSASAEEDEHGDMPALEDVSEEEREEDRIRVRVRVWRARNDLAWMFC